MRFGSFIITFLCLTFGLTQLSSQTIDLAANDYNAFVQQYNSGNANTAYPLLHKSCEGFLQVLNEQDAHSTAYIQAANALKTMFPYIERAIIYYYSKGNQKSTIQYAQDYTLVYAHPSMKNNELKTGQDHINYIKIAATGAWKSKDYLKAAIFFRAYLSEADADSNFHLRAFVNYGQCYYEKGDYENAKKIWELGLEQFPNNDTLLQNLVSASNNSKDDERLKKYLQLRIIALKRETPSNRNREELSKMLKIKGEMEERNNQFEQAIETFNQLKQMKPNSIEPIKHLAYNYYNAGVAHHNLSISNNGNTRSSSHSLLAKDLFLQSEPFFIEMTRAYPYEVKYIYALANIYNTLGQKEKLKAMNENIAKLGYEPVSDDMKQVIQNIAMNNDESKGVQRRQKGLETAATSLPQPVANMRKEDKKSNLKAISDVDINIPSNSTNNENTFAVIIANEHYSRVAQVPMAGNDGHIFAEYCHKVLGLPKQNIRDYYDATSLIMNDALNDIKGIANAYQGNLNIIFYYAGHGIPDESSRDAFLLPIDAGGQSTTGLMSLSHLYKELGEVGANCITVFLDACFSGSQRGEGMLASARGIAIKPKPATPQGNMVVFSAATGAQTAMPYKEKQHGLFTYYLLKKLQETRGNVTLEELGQYVTSKVTQQAQVVNRKPQTPTVHSSQSFGETWKKMKLIK